MQGEKKKINGGSCRLVPNKFDVMIGNILRKKRKENRYSIEIMSQYLGVSQACYSKYERGEIKIPIERFFKMAIFFQIDLKNECGEIFDYFKIILDI